MTERNDRIPLKGGDEYDALTRMRKWYGHTAGVVRQIKAQYNRRRRRMVRAELKKEPV
jgi:hypothetical protein